MKIKHHLILALLIANLSLFQEVSAGDRISFCGGEGQRPCRLWEAIPSCDSGLVEDFVLDECVSTSGGGGGGGGSGFPSTCGAEGQRPCLVIEHIPSCEPGLVENFLDNKCLPDGEGAQIGEIVANFEPPDCDTIFDTNTTPTINSLYNFKLATGIPAKLAEEIVPKDTVATPARVVSAIAYLTIFYCELTLEREVNQIAADFQSEKFAEILEDLAQRESELNNLSNSLQNHDAEVKSAVLSHDADIKSAVQSHDTAVMTELQNLKNDLETRLSEIKTLIETPPGFRQGYSNN